MQYNKVSLRDWLASDLYNALTRFAVPVFVMITGALLLHREYELGDFLKRRLTRIIWPFLFWSLVYIGYSWYNEEIAFGNDVWANTKIVLHQLKYGAYYHLWYVYMLIGLYFFIPVISRFVRAATEKEIAYFLVVWFIVIAFTQPYLSHYWPQIDVRYFTGYLGYLVLGHHLAFRPMPSGIKPILVVYYLLCLVGITAGTYFITANTNNLSTIMYEPLGPFVILYASGIFLLARVIVFKLPQSLVKMRDLAGALSLGIYLCHALFLTLLDDLLNISYKLCDPYISIPLTAMICFILSFLLIFGLSKIPVIGKYIAG